MSGGSYNYLCWARDLEDLNGKRDTLREMADRLAGLGYAQDAAAETEELLVMLQQWEVRATVRAARLAEVWKAVEWWDSCDSGEDDVRGALAAYRGEPGQAEINPRARRAYGMTNEQQIPAGDLSTSVTMKGDTGQPLYYTALDGRTVEQTLIDAGLYAARSGHRMPQFVSVTQSGTG